VPMAEAVVFAMIASFVLSRTLVPTMAMYLLKPQARASGAATNILSRFQHGFEARFSKIREGYRSLLASALATRWPFIAGFMAFVLLSFGLEPLLGDNFFPSVDSGEMTLHVRAPVGTRLEDTAALFDHVEQAIRREIPPEQLKGIVDNIGLPVSGINRAYSNTGGIGPQDGDIYITLSAKHRATADYVRQLRIDLPKLFPGSTFSFLPADIISQILNFGAPAPIDLQVSGPSRDQNEAYADEVMARMKLVPGLADVRRQQSTHYPQFKVGVDRTQADALGLTERDVTTTMVTTLTGSFQTAPAFWLNPKNGVSYPIVVQSPQQDVNTLSKLQNIPISGGKPGDMQILGGLATIGRGNADAVVSHYAIQPSFDIYATPQDRDLGSVAKAIQTILKDTAKDLPKGATVTLRGQVNTMNSAFLGLSLGLLGAIVLIYLLIVVNFQSWIDPFVIITALPAALAGILWMLFTTQTPLSVPALTGAIMCMGVATANSILVVSFARERLEHTGDAVVAAIEAGFTRFRPVLMTALAMIIGMAPMALGLGEGGEQNAPLGRAVIGGLIFATFATLLFVPVVFSLAHPSKASATEPQNTPTDPDLGEAYAG
jgi:multidrug efflux pump subunit AcrB